MEKPTQEQWQAWHAHKSNKERFIEATEAEEARQDEIKEDATSMEEKLKDVQYMLHKIVSIIRRINRDGKLNDEEIAMLHQDIDLFFRNY